MGKGSRQRSGNGYSDNYDRIFNKPTKPDEESKGSDTEVDEVKSEPDLCEPLPLPS